MRAPFCLAVGLLFPACVAPGRAPLLVDPVPSALPTLAQLVTPPPEESSRRAIVVKKAQSLLAGAPLRVSGYTFEPDPVGFVRAAFWSAGIDLYSHQPSDHPRADGMAALFQSRPVATGRHRNEPNPGDLVFFNEQAGSEPPGPSGVAVVEQVLRNGTVVAIGTFAQGPRRIAMNLREPDKERGADGTRLNDILVGDKRATAAKLWRCYSSPF